MVSGDNVKADELKKKIEECKALEDDPHIAQLKVEMAAAVESEDFEKAAALKKTIKTAESKAAERELPESSTLNLVAEGFRAMQARLEELTMTVDEQRAAVERLGSRPFGGASRDPQGFAAESFGRVSLLYSRKEFIGRRSRVPSGAWLLGGNCGDDSAPSVVAGVSAGKANGFVSSDGTGEPRGDARELSELDEPASSSSSLYHEFCLGSREERRAIVG